MLRLLTASACALLAAAPAAADTLTVDDDGGADYTEIASAVLAALDGDVIVVRTGTYAGFTVGDVDLVLTADTCAIVTGPVVVSGQSAAKSLVLSGLQVPDLSVSSCAGHVLVDRFQVETVNVSQSADVRFHACVVDPNVAGQELGRTAIVATGSRVEIASSTVVGEVADASGFPPTSGSGIFADGTRLHVAVSAVAGGWGDDDFVDGGHGGTGVFAQGQSELLAAGRSTDEIRGGDGGDGLFDGDGGDAVFLAGQTETLRHSGLVLMGGSPFGLPIGGQGAATQPQPADPSVELADPATFTFRVWSEPGTLGRLMFGTRPTLTTDNLVVEQLVTPLRSTPFGPVGAQGWIDVSVPEMGAFGVGTAFVVQGFLLVAPGDLRRTNSAVLVRDDPLFGPDCNANCVPDALDPDCNANGLPDDCDIADGTSADVNGNGVPDECEVDCNANGLPDDTDIALGTSFDCNQNGVPDECDLAQGTEADCNGNGIPDACEDDWFQSQKLAPSSAMFARVGGALALAGPTLYTAPGNNSSQDPVVHVLRTGPAGWFLDDVLTALGASIQFGTDLAADGRTVVVGDPLSAPAGVAQVFDRNASGQIVLTTTLAAAAGAGGDAFGRSVAILGPTIAVGAPLEDDTGGDSGSVHVFGRSGGVWGATQELHASDAALDEQFGAELALGPGVLVVGAFTDDAEGAVYVFRPDATGAWIESQKLLPSMAGAHQGFGRALELSGGRLVVGASLDDDAGSNAGATYVFTDGPTGFVLEQKFFAPAPQDFAAFGSAVALHAGDLVVGEPGRNDGTPFGDGLAYVFRESSPGSWSLFDTLDREEFNDFDRYGTAVAAGPAGLFVGSPRDDQNAFDSGAVHVFEFEPDCNDNGVPDACDVSSGTSADVNGNGIPDECEP